MNSPSMCTLSTIPITLESMITIRWADQVWWYLIPPSSECVIINYLFFRQKETVHCVIVHNEKVYSSIWSGRAKKSRCLMGFAERLVAALSFFLSVLESDEVEKIDGIFVNTNIRKWDQFLRLIDVFSRMIQSKGRLKEELEKIVRKHRVDPIKFKMLLHQVLHDNFSPVELLSSRTS